MATNNKKVQPKTERQAQKENLGQRRVTRPDSTVDGGQKRVGRQSKNRKKSK